MALIQDLRLIVDAVLPNDPSFGSVGRQILDQHIKDAMAQAGADAKDEFLLALMRLLALPGNGHTRLIPNGAISVLPLRFVTIGTAVRLLGAPAGFAPAIGGELIAINGVPTHEIEHRAAGLLSGTQPRKRVIGPILFAWTGALRHLGLCTAADAVEYQILDRAGQIRHLHLTRAMQVPGTSLYPRSEHGRADSSWSPASFLTAKDFEKCGLFLALPSFFDPSETALSQAITRAKDLVISRPDAPLLIDLRGNTGGDFLRAMPLVDAISQGAAGRKVGVLVDKFTFSAAIVFVAILKHRLKDRLVLIGEEMGDGLTFYAEGETLDLPASGAAVRYSTAFHDWANGRADATTPPNIAERLVPAGALKIDHPWVGGAADTDPPEPFCRQVLDSLKA